jgi:branched-chain amino acid transport system substrate-binding protein
MRKCFARYCIAAAAIAVALLGGAVPGAQAQDTLKFGVADPLTGPSALFGLDQMQAVRWAVEDINANGGRPSRKLPSALSVGLSMSTKCRFSSPRSATP